jgi:formylmethanofuran dehydrogenase subunit E
MGQYKQMGFRSPKRNCDRCGLTYYEDELKKQDGLWLCPDDYDKKED